MTLTYSTHAEYLPVQNIQPRHQKVKAAAESRASLPGVCILTTAAGLVHFAFNPFSCLINYTD